MGPTDSSVSVSPPVVLVLGESADYSKMCAASLGETVLVPVGSGVQHSSGPECTYTLLAYTVHQRAGVLLLVHASSSQALFT